MTRSSGLQYKFTTLSWQSLDLHVRNQPGEGRRQSSLRFEWFEQATQKEKSKIRKGVPDL
eukprot:664556-Hanusia_phi.AAC.1